uniref:Uncharacterized protein n=1 Tax=Eutreptiella gymnastica TaxID=73025 RepID=A0A7S1J9X3_9EUGL
MPPGLAADRVRRQPPPPPSWLAVLPGGPRARAWQVRRACPSGRWALAGLCGVTVVLWLLPTRHTIASRPAGDAGRNFKSPVSSLAASVYILKLRCSLLQRYTGQEQP